LRARQSTGPRPSFSAAPGACLDQHIGAVGQSQHGVAARRPLEVQRQRAPPARIDVVSRIHGQAQAAGFEAVDAHDISAQVGQQHAAQRPRADAREFDHPQSVERSHGRRVCLKRSRFLPGAGACRPWAAIAASTGPEHRDGNLAPA